MATQEDKLVKKTVVIEPTMDECIRKTWSILIELGYDATYSMAMNAMLVLAVAEGSKEGGASQEAIDIMKSFINDREVIRRLNAQEYLAQAREWWGENR